MMALAEAILPYSTHVSYRDSSVVSLARARKYRFRLLYSSAVNPCTLLFDLLLRPAPGRPDFLLRGFPLLCPDGGVCACCVASGCAALGGVPAMVTLLACSASSSTGSLAALVGSTTSPGF